VETVDPNNLITHRRFDVIVKYLYASNLSSKYFKNLYKEHLRVWNGFYEGTPRKRGFEDFDDAFKSIIDNTVDEPVPVNSDGDIVNGSHRLAAALHLQRPINIRDLTPKENPRIESNYEFFIERNGGMPKHMLQRTALEYVKLKSNSHIVCLFPICFDRMKDVMNVINKHSNLFYHSDTTLNSEGQLNLMKEIYLTDGWANEEGIRRKGNQCFMGRNNVRFLVIDGKDLATVKDMKNKVRALFNVGNHCVHITDTHEEAIRVAKTVFNDNSIHFLNNRKNVSFPNYVKLLKASKPSDNTVITGSSVLSLYGLRDCKDLDIIDYDNVLTDTHNQYLEKFYKITLDDIVNNPCNHLYYNGHKYVSLNVIKNMKETRNESKDVTDLQLIEKISS
tara:strand:- start:2107 stop:3279 length:1173 start_codon:yes stop_codon:yes gene_type:complete